MIFCLRGHNLNHRLRSLQRPESLHALSSPEWTVEIEAGFQTTYNSIQTVKMPKPHTFLFSYSVRSGLTSKSIDRLKRCPLSLFLLIMTFVYSLTNLIYIFGINGMALQVVCDLLDNKNKDIFLCVCV